MTGPVCWIRGYWQRRRARFLMLGPSLSTRRSAYIPTLRVAGCAQREDPAFVTFYSSCPSSDVGRGRRFRLRRLLRGSASER